MPSKGLGFDLLQGVRPEPLRRLSYQTIPTNLIQVMLAEGCNGPQSLPSLA